MGEMDEGDEDHSCLEEHCTMYRIAESLHWTPETEITVHGNCTSI